MDLSQSRDNLINLDLTQGSQMCRATTTALRLMKTTGVVETLPTRTIYFQ